MLSSVFNPFGWPVHEGLGDLTKALLACTGRAIYLPKVLLITIDCQKRWLRF